jgi:hypothetical protein
MMKMGEWCLGWRGRGQGECGLERIKHTLLEGSPQSRLIISSEKVQGCNNIEEIGNKLAVEVGKSQEGSDSFYRGRGFPFTNGSELGRIHFNLSLTNDHTQEIHVRGIKDTFRQLEGKSMFAKTKENTTGSFMM